MNFIGEYIDYNVGFVLLFVFVQRCIVIVEVVEVVEVIVTFN